MLNAIAKQQGFKIKWNHVGFQPAVDAVQAGHADAMMAGMSITDARKKSLTLVMPIMIRI